MTLLIGWLFGSSALPAGPLVWSGLGTAIVLTLLLLTTLGLLVWQHEPRREAAGPVSDRSLRRRGVADPQLPSAA